MNGSEAMDEAAADAVGSTERADSILSFGK